MISRPKFGPDKEHAYQDERARVDAPTQRWLLLCGGLLYCLAGVWVSFRSGETAGILATYSLVLMAFTVVMFGMSYLRFVRERDEILPILFAVAYGAHIIFGVIDMPDEGGLRFGLLFALLNIYVVMLSATLQVALAALVSSVIVAVVGSALAFPFQSVEINIAAAYGYLLPSAALAIVLAITRDRLSREAFSLKWELRRRATTDELSGVSNRSHVITLAENEFSRARRYREPFSCLVIEIDGLDDVRDSWGDYASDTIVRVISGYCVLVMRHCDSFGRLAQNRFIALLPETPGSGAMILARRMVRDIGKLDALVYGETLRCTVSIGVSELNRRDRGGRDLVRRAEQGVEDAIEQGRNTAVYAAPPPELDEELELDIAAATAAIPPDDI